MRMFIVYFNGFFSFKLFAINSILMFRKQNFRSRKCAFIFK